ncbi:uncharacterized protein LOC125178409 [Hyalella azteca]|uniref:Uncharacterized protein LOC125178409 n=1 Tax=Hyalella azteca TaxID=294128 RepID=A0A979FPC2_HYAAZ|nr:uncharacterized protein LOC125178409 [Hyalella azteca]
MSCRSLNIQPKRVHWDHHGEISKSLSQDRSFPCTSTNSEIIVVEVAFTFSEAYSFCASLDIDMVDILNERNLESTWCASGSCILPEKICDQVRDCDDGSDEISCTTHQITAAQKSSQPTEKINSINSKPAEVDFDVEVLRLIKKSDEPLQAVIKLSMTWTNTETEFPSIKHGHSSRLPDSFAAWKPSIIPEGLPPKADSCIGQECDNPSLLTVVTSQTASFSGVDLSGDKLLRNVTLRLTRLSVHSLDCGGEYMTFFPFEQHVCEINFKTKYENYSLKSLSAAPPPGFIPHFIVLKVLIKGWGSQQDSIGFSQAVLKIHVKRLTGFYVVVVFIPSFLLLMLNSILLWVKDPHEYRLLSSTFTVISFLIMWMIIVSNSPNSSSIRAIDVWMCFCLTHSILHVIVNTIIRALLVGDDETRSRRLSTLSSRPLSRLRQVKPLELNSLYDVLLAKMAMEENENKWTHAYWVMFCARIVSPVLTLLFMISFWPFVVYFSQENL